MDLSLPTGVEAEKDRDALGGGAIESGVYKGIIDMLFIDTFPSGAQKFNIHFKHDGRVTKYDFCISTRPQADGNVRYTYPKGGKDNPLPGYSEMDRFFVALTGSITAQQSNQLKTVNIFNYKEKKEVPTEVTVFTDCIGKELAVGILSIKEEGTLAQSQDSAHPPYSEGTGKLYNKNKFDKYFDAKSGLTTTEKQAGATEPAFLDKWKKKNDGVTQTIQAEFTGLVDGKEPSDSAPASTGGASTQKAIFT